MTNHELTTSDFGPPSPEVLTSMSELVTEVNGFIERDPEGHLDMQKLEDGTEKAHRFIVVRRTYDQEGEFSFSASTIERPNGVDDVVLSVSKDLTLYYFEGSPTRVESTLTITDRKPPVDRSQPRNLIAAIGDSLNQAAESHRLGVSKPTQGGMQDLIAVTREVMGRVARSRKG